MHVYFFLLVLFIWYDEKIVMVLLLGQNYFFLQKSRKYNFFISFFSIALFVIHTLFSSIILIITAKVTWINFILTKNIIIFVLIWMNWLFLCKKLVKFSTISHIYHIFQKLPNQIIRMADNNRATSSDEYVLINNNSLIQNQAREMPQVYVEPCQTDFFYDKFKQSYPMFKNPRGLCLIVNIYQIDGMPPRRWSNRDTDSLKQLFEQLLFTVKTYTDSTHDLSCQVSE